MIFCKECGRELADTALFCTGCGRKMQEQSIPTPVQEGPVAVTPQEVLVKPQKIEKKKRKPLKFCFHFLLYLILVLGSSFLTLYFLIPYLIPQQNSDEFIPFSPTIGIVEDY